MSRPRVSLALVVVAGLAAALAAQEKKGAEAAPLLTAAGLVDRAGKEALTVRPRGADGKFQKAVTLKVTGTSKVTVLTPQKRADKMVLTQREVAAGELVAGQAVAVIFTESGNDGAVLLSAVAQPAPRK